MNDLITYKELINDCFSDLWTLHLTFIGILLSLITLLYSFILSKKDELKLVTEQIHLGDSSPLVIQKKSFAINYIKRLVAINCHCFRILLSSIFLALCSWIGLRFLTGGIAFWVLVIIAVLTIIVIGYIIYLAIRMLKQYKNDTRI